MLTVCADRAARRPDTDASLFLETYLVNQTMQFIDNVTARRPSNHGAGTGKGTGTGKGPETGARTPWFVYTSMVSPHPPNWVPRGPWSDVYANTTLPPINYKGGDIQG